jgi:hypothetical protein
MDQRERQVIDELFGKLRQVERQAPQRDSEAEAHIRQQVSGLPAAPYYMAQAILVQEQALANMQSRVQALGVAGGVLVADALSNAFAGGEEAVTGLAEEANAPAEEGVSPFQDAAAEPLPEEHDMGGFDDGFEEI